MSAVVIIVTGERLRNVLCNVSQRVEKGLELRGNVLHLFLGFSSFFRIKINFKFYCTMLDFRLPPESS
jgi:hypothetical protein